MIWGSFGFENIKRFILKITFAGTCQRCTKMREQSIERVKIYSLSSSNFLQL